MNATHENTPAATVATISKKEQICTALRAFIAQRSGIDYRNYGNRESLMGDYRPMIRHGQHARTMLRAVELRESITAEDLMRAARGAFAGRLSIVEREDGAVAVDYCTGQYFPTEYRKAACAVLALALWDYWRENMPPLAVATSPATSQPGIINAGDYIRRQARREFGRAIASTWFS